MNKDQNEDSIHGGENGSVSGAAAEKSKMILLIKREEKKIQARVRG
jgi:hypothetical protein